MSYTNQQAIKEIRSTAKSVGLTFKQDKSIRLNGAYLWIFSDRKTGELVMSNCTLSGAYENICSGFIASYDAKTSNFLGVR